MEDKRKCSICGKMSEHYTVTSVDFKVVCIDCLKKSDNPLHKVILSMSKHLKESK